MVVFAPLTLDAFLQAPEHPAANPAGNAFAQFQVRVDVLRLFLAGSKRFSRF